MRCKILNTRKKKRLESELTRRYSTPSGIFSSVDLFTDGQRTWAASKNLINEDFEGFHLHSIGMLVLRGDVPTIACVQAFFKGAKFDDLTEEEASKAIKGERSGIRGGVFGYGGYPLDIVRF